MRWPFGNLTAGYSSLSTTRTRRINFRMLAAILKWAAILLAVVIAAFFIVCRVDTHMRIYTRFWLSPRKPVTVEPLSQNGRCFRDLSPRYQQGRTTHSVNVMPGYRMQDDTCFGYARTIKPSPRRSASAGNGNSTVIYFHTTWSSSSSAEIFGQAQLAILRSFVATQDPDTTRLLVWIDDADRRMLDDSPYWKEAVEHTDRIRYEIIPPPLAQDDKTAGDNDRTRHRLLTSLTALSKYGGVWFDLNTLFVRDLGPLLLGNDWIAQATCYTSVEGNPFAGSSTMYFDKDSPYLCELINAANDDNDNDNRRPREAGWHDAGNLYYRVYTRILRNGNKPWSIVPWCYFEPSQCTKSTRLPSPFAPDSTAFADRWLDSVFAYRFHDTPPSTPSGAIYDSLNNKYKHEVEW